MSQVKSVNSNNSMVDFFAKKEEKYELLPVLGFDYWKMDNSEIAKIYVGVPADPLNENRGGITPVTYAVNPELVPLLRKIERYPAHIDCLVVSVVGSKNKSVNTVTSIKVGNV